MYCDVRAKCPSVTLSRLSTMLANVNTMPFCNCSVRSVCSISSLTCKRLAMRFSSTGAKNGLKIKSTAPCESPFASILESLKLDENITGIFAVCLFAMIFASAAKPSISGISTSSKIMSGVVLGNSENIFSTEIIEIT